MQTLIICIMAVVNKPMMLLTVVLSHVSLSREGLSQNTFKMIDLHLEYLPCKENSKTMKKRSRPYTRATIPITNLGVMRALYRRGMQMAI